LQETRPDGNRLVAGMIGSGSLRQPVPGSKHAMNDFLRAKYLGRSNLPDYRRSPVPALSPAQFRQMLAGA